MRPLERIRIVDLSHVFAGPFATHQLCMMGAEIIKVEKPGVGDDTRQLALHPELNGLAASFVALNTGKRSFVADLKTDQGLQAVKRLVATADVFVENFRPGTAAKLGLSAEKLQASNPKLIYCSISGWGQVGPHAERPAYDHVIQAATGMMALQGDRPDAPPTKVGFPVVDIGAGMLASSAILAALLRRARGDDARIVLDVSMVDAALLLMTGTIAKYWASGVSPSPAGNRGFMGSPGSDTFPTADGWISTAANTLRQFETMCGVLGRPDLIENRALLPVLPKSKSGFLINLSSEALRRELMQAFAADSARAWEGKLLAAGVPASRVNSLASFLNEEYLRTGRVDVPISAHAYEKATQSRVFNEGFRWTGDAQAIAGHPPTLGEHTKEILDELDRREASGFAAN